MSFAALKKNSRTQFKQLADKMASEGKTNYDDNRYWTPEIDKSGSGFAIIRFLPAIEGEETPYVKTYSHGFKHGAKWFIENCPTTIGQPCPVCDANSELWETNLKENQDIVRHRKRQVRYISNIMVLSDAKRPQNEGKVFLFSYGQKIFAKLMSAIEPEFADETPFNPYDFWEGAPFKLKIRNVEGFRNYDKCEFGECCPLSEEDEELEAIWKSQYKLQEFLQPSQFKSYDDIKNKFLGIIKGGGFVPPRQDHDDDSGNDNGSDEKEEKQAARRPSPRREEPATPRKPAAPTQEASGDDSEDFEMFRSLIED